MSSPRADIVQTGQRIYTLHEAALLLGLSIEAVRKHAERGKLDSIKYEDGTRHILLDLFRESPYLT
jgi:hypothetical protein